MQAKEFDATLQRIDVVDVPMYQYITESKGWLAKYFRMGSGFIDWGEQPVPFDPWVIGLWIGDGASAGATITIGDESEIKLALKETLAKYGCRMSVPKYPHLNHGVSGRYQGRYPFLDALRELDLIKNKHMPIKYLFNSKEVRLELLAGLIDSDGSLNYAESRYRFDQKDKKLVDAVSYLARSLGFRSSIHINAMREVTLPQGTKIMSEMHYTFISGTGVGQIPCRTPRKQVNPDYKAQSSYARYGAKAKSIGYGKYVGFELDCDGSFLLSDFTVATMPAVERETFVRTKRLKSGTRKTM